MPKGNGDRAVYPLDLCPLPRGGRGECRKAMETRSSFPCFRLVSNVVDAVNAERQWRRTVATLSLIEGYAGVVDAVNAERQWRLDEQTAAYFVHAGWWTR